METGAKSAMIAAQAKIDHVFRCQRPPGQNGTGRDGSFLRRSPGLATHAAIPRAAARTRSREHRFSKGGYAWERSPAFAKRQRLLSPKEYEIVEVRTSRGMNRAMLFSEAILLAEWEAHAPIREAMAIKRERWRVKRA
jgi:hypothetical protein